VNMATTNDPDLLNSAIAQYVETDPSAQEEDVSSFVPAQDRVVTLPGGLVLPDGEVIHDIEVRELNGRDEEAISKVRTLGKVLSLIVERGISRVGGRPTTETDLNSMLAGDRDYALLHIYSVTFGSEVTATRTCPSCRETVDVVVDLDALPVRRLESPQDRYFTVQTSRGEARVELPTGITQKSLYENSEKSLAELSTILLSNTVTRIGNSPVLGARQVQDLSIRDRRVIAEEISKRNPGPETVTKKNCPLCGEEMEVAISIASLFQS
jgi:hypothetical protein